jgi:hypothetical protein
LRGCVIGNDHQASEVDAADAAWRLMAWLTDGVNSMLAEAIQTWLWQPPKAGGLGVLAGIGRDVTALRTEIAALWRHIPQQREPDGREAR